MITYQNKPLPELTDEELEDARVLAVQQYTFDYLSKRQLDEINREIQNREIPFEAHRRLYI